MKRLKKLESVANAKPVNSVGVGPRAKNGWT